jgi:putative hydrolase of HD superfamily
MIENKTKPDLNALLEFYQFVGQLKFLERFIGQVFWKEYDLKKRWESVADHTWRMAIILVTLRPYISLEFDLVKTIKMILIHDLPEIIVGDMSPLGETGTGEDSHYKDKNKKQIKFEKEKVAAEIIFAKLPKNIGSELYDLWLESEKCESNESKIVKALDKLEAKIQVLDYTDGLMFKDHLAFTLDFSRDIYDIDPVLKDFRDMLNSILEEKFEEFAK